MVFMCYNVDENIIQQHAAYNAVQMLFLFETSLYKK